jgi:hypothetical protein
MEFLAFNQVDGVVAEVMRFKIERKFQRGREREREREEMTRYVK